MCPPLRSYRQGLVFHLLVSTPVRRAQAAAAAYGCMHGRRANAGTPPQILHADLSSRGPWGARWRQTRRRIARRARRPRRAQTGHARPPLTRQCTCSAAQGPSRTGTCVGQQARGGEGGCVDGQPTSMLSRRLCVCWVPQGRGYSVDLGCSGDAGGRAASGNQAAALCAGCSHCKPRLGSQPWRQASTPLDDQQAHPTLPQPEGQWKQAGEERAHWSCPQPPAART